MGAAVGGWVVGGRAVAGAGGGDRDRVVGDTHACEQPGHRCACAQSQGRARPTVASMWYALSHTLSVGQIDWK